MRSTGPSSATVDAVCERAGHSCEICSSGVGDRRGVDFSIHHRRARKMGGTRWAGINLPSNLLILCGSGVDGCHGWVESNRSASVAAGWLVLSRQDPAHVQVLICKVWKYLDNEGQYREVE